MTHQASSIGHEELPPIRLKPPTPPTTTTVSTPHVTVSTPTFSGGVNTPTAGATRKIAIAVDLSDESAFAVKWAVDHYIRPGDAVVLLHVRPTSVLYGADWGSASSNDDKDNENENDNDNDGGVNNKNSSEESKKKLEDDFDAFTTSKAADLAHLLADAQVPHKIHIVKDHDMRERLCLEVERLGFHVVIMGSRGFGATKRGSDGKLGSVSDYCVRHCDCPVVVVRCPDAKDGKGGGDGAIVSMNSGQAEEEEDHYHDAADDQPTTETA